LSPPGQKLRRLAVRKPPILSFALQTKKEQHINGLLPQADRASSEKSLISQADINKPHINSIWVCQQTEEQKQSKLSLNPLDNEREKQMGNQYAHLPRWRKLLRIRPVF